MCRENDALLATTMKPLNALPRFENHFAIKTVHFQVSLDAGSYFFAQEVFAFATAASRASRYHLASFEPDFLQIQLQNTCWASPKPDIQHKIALNVHLILQRHYDPQESWYRPALSFFAKVSLVFSCKLPKVTYYQSFLLTLLDFCGNLSQQFNITYLS